MFIISILYIFLMCAARSHVFHWYRNMYQFIFVASNLVLFFSFFIIIVKYEFNRMERELQS